MLKIRVICQFRLQKGPFLSNKPPKTAKKGLHNIVRCVILNKVFVAPKSFYDAEARLRVKILFS